MSHKLTDSDYDVTFAEKNKLQPLKEWPLAVNAVFVAVPTLIELWLLITFLPWYGVIIWLLGYLGVVALLFMQLTDYVEKSYKKLPKYDDAMKKQKALRKSLSSNSSVSSTASGITSSKRLSIFERVEGPESDAVNPFDNYSWELSIMERLRGSLTFPILAPPRIFVALMSQLAISFLAYISILGMSRKSLSTKPLPFWRKMFMYPLPILSRIQMHGLGYHWINVYGKIASREEAPIATPNHISFLEPVYLTGALGTSPVGAYEQIHKPLIGTVLKALQIITVKRTDPNSRHEVVETLKKRPVQKGWNKILIFPEGTTHNGEALTSFKAGAFLSGQPVQPVVLKLMHNRRLDLSWVPAGPDMLFLLFRVLSEPCNQLSVRYLPVYKPSAAEKKNPQLFADNVRLVMCAALGVPATDHSFLDVIMQKMALKKNVPPSSSMIGVNRVMKTFHVTFDSVKRYYEKFCEIDVEHRGRIRLQEFLTTFAPKESPQSPFFINLFNLLDTDTSGEIDFREFLIGLCMVNECGENTDEIVRFGFHMFDLDGDGFIEVAHLRRLFLRGFPDMKEEQVNELVAQETKNNVTKVDYDRFKAIVTSDKRFLKVFKRIFKFDMDTATSEPGEAKKLK